MTVRELKDILLKLDDSLLSYEPVGGFTIDTHLDGTEIPENVSVQVDLKKKEVVIK